MPVRLAACEACRTAKLSCNHAKPMCSRCAEADDGRSCVYRDKPFKRKRPRPSNKQRVTASTSLHVNESPTTASSERVVEQTNTYPNPGYLGTSSHAAIFQHVSPSYCSSSRIISPGVQIDVSTPQMRLPRAAQMSSWSELLREISRAPLSAYGTLVEVWLSTCANLALAGPFVVGCANSVLTLFQSGAFSSTHAAQLSQRLSTESCNPLDVDGSATIDSFSASFCDSRCRWETLGLFFAAVSRATVDVACFRPLYDAWQERVALRQMAMRLADSCLDIALSLDCLNDLQLMLQYESFIVHSCVDGDQIQGYQSWRRLGDVISSLLALGYHERVGKETDTPPFLRDIRSAAFARAYSADKNVSIFLGRPPRLNRNFSCLRIKGALHDVLIDDPNSAGICWDIASSSNSDYNQGIETCWSAICAWLKERILDLRRARDSELKQIQAATIASDAATQWLALPSQYRLETRLRTCSRKSIERDFMVSARLNYLHVLFLLRISLLKRVDQHDEELIDLASSMLTLAVEAVVLRDQLTNSGTGLVWRMAHYGLPAAGILCLALLSKTYPADTTDITKSSVTQDLSTLVTHVDTSALVHPEEPNYALFAAATRCISSVLQNTATDHTSLPPAGSMTLQDDVEWMSWMTGSDLQDFEMDFWNTLSGHLPAA